MSPKFHRSRVRSCWLLLPFTLMAAACAPDTTPGAGEALPSADAPQPPHGEIDPAPGQPAGPPPGEISPAPWDAARERGAAWRGIGQEPGWNVEIHADRIVYVGDYGETNITAPAGEPTIAGNARTWHATTSDADIRVVFEELPCTDIMSGEEFPLTVRITVNGEELRGCGRRL